MKKYKNNLLWFTFYRNWRMREEWNHYKRISEMFGFYFIYKSSFFANEASTKCKKKVVGVNY